LFADTTLWIVKVVMKKARRRRGYAKCNAFKSF